MNVTVFRKRTGEYQEVAYLFGYDPICLPLLSLYYHLRPWAYIAFWAAVLMGLPALVLGVKNSTLAPDIFLNPILVAVGSWIAAIWFRATLSFPENWQDGLKQSRSDFFKGTNLAMRSPKSYVSTFILFAVPIVGVAYLETKAARVVTIGTIVAYGPTIVWWWMIARTFVLSTLVFRDFRSVLLAERTKERVNLHDEGNAFGFKSVVTYVNPFLWFYVFMGAGLLFAYQIVFHIRYEKIWSFNPPTPIAVVFTAAVWTPYLLLPLHAYFCTLRPCAKWVARVRDERLRQIAEDISKSEADADFEQLERQEKQYDRLKRINLAKQLGVIQTLQRSAVQFVSLIASTLIPKWIGSGVHL